MAHGLNGLDGFERIRADLFDPLDPCSINLKILAPLNGFGNFFD